MSKYLVPVVSALSVMGAAGIAYALLTKRPKPATKQANVPPPDDNPPAESGNASDAPSTGVDCAGCSRVGECVDMEDVGDMYGTTRVVDWHVIVCTGAYSDGLWMEKYEKTEGGFGTTIHKCLKEADLLRSKKKKDEPPPPVPLLDVMLTAVAEDSERDEDENGAELCDVLVFGCLFPEGTRMTLPATEAGAKAFVSELRSIGLAQKQGSEVDASFSAFRPRPLGYDHLILVCTHKSRDKRCGRIGPEVLKSFAEEVEKREDAGTLTKRVAVRASSHTGGHKYAGVAVVYPQATWYGRLDTKSAPRVLDAIVADMRMHKYLRGVDCVKMRK